MLHCRLPLYFHVCRLCFLYYCLFVNLNLDQFPCFVITSILWTICSCSIRIIMISFFFWKLPCATIFADIKTKKLIGSFELNQITRPLYPNNTLLILTVCPCSSSIIRYKFLKKVPYASIFPDIKRSAVCPIGKVLNWILRGESGYETGVSSSSVAYREGR